jgi:hypothetical protein
VKHLATGAVLAALILPATAGADARPPVCDKHPVLATAAGAVERAAKGWNARTLKTNGEAIRRVRVQRRCAPSKKGRRHVRHVIADARREYKTAVEAAGNPYPDPPLLAYYSELYAIGGCESGHDPAAVSPDGTYRGYFQFDYGTWGSVGGSGDPAAASVEEQYYRANTLYSQRGSQPWPVCG